MNFLLLTITLLIAGLIALMGMIVLLKDGHSRLNRSFFYFTSFVSLWIVTNYFSNSYAISQSTAELLNHLVLFSSGIAVLSLFMFTSHLTGILTDKLKIIVAVGWIGPLLSLTPLVILGIERQGEVYALNFGPLSPVYFLSLFAEFIAVILMLVIAFRRSKKTEKDQIEIVLWSFGLTLSLAILSNALLPVLFGTFEATSVGPLASLILVLGIAYGIIRHRLFDIRLIIARSVGYILALLFLALIYGFAAFYLLDEVFFPGTPMDITTKRIVYISLALFSGLSYAPAKRMFDRWSNKIFYRDAYDAQRFIDGLTSISVSNTDIDKLLTSSSELIEANLKPTYTVFALKDGESAKLKVRGKITHNFNDEEIENILQYTDSLKEKVIEIDGLDKGLNLPVERILSKHDVAILIKMTNFDKLIGVLLVGVKQSGNVYNKQDLDIFEIVADELSLAVENSLSYEEIQRFNITLQEEVHDATKKLQRSNDKLKALDETKDEFISMASHQLRTPLTSVKGYLSMVLEGDAGELNEQQRKLLTQAFTSSQRMVYLIADLLNVSRLRTGKFVIEAKPTSLPELVAGELEQLKAAAAGKNLELTFSPPQDFPTLNLDDTKIRQVIMNFTDNAIYYTPSGGKIRVELEAKPDAVEFRVVDNGLGVPKAEQHHLFTKFYRAGNAKRARPDGTGLGLFMAKKVVIAQGGAIIFKSTEGKGSTFGFTFPRRPLEVKNDG